MEAQHSTQQSPPAASPEELPDPQHSDASQRDQQRSDNTESNALFSAGGVIAVFGLALATAPEYSWRLTKIAHALATAGVESGILIVGGLVLLGIGLLARQRVQPVAFIAAPKSSEADGDFRLIVAQLITKLTHLSTSSLQVSEDVTAMAGVQKSLFSKLNGKDDLALEHRDALFRLASSMDKLNAHFDERIHAFDLQVRGGLDSVIHALNQTRHHLEAHIDASASQPSSKMSPGFSPITPANEELHILVDLEGPAPTIPMTTPEESADFFGTTLDRLDELAGDFDAPNPPGTMPSNPHDLRRTPEEQN